VLQKLIVLGRSSGLQPEEVTPKMESLIILFTIISDGLMTMLMAMSTVGIYLIKELLLVLLLLAVVEVLRSFLQFLLQLIVIGISIFLGVVVYTTTFLVNTGRIMFAEPLEQAVAWQRMSMLWMNSYLADG